MKKDITPSFNQEMYHKAMERPQGTVLDSDDDTSQQPKNFDPQKADFESKSDASQTASEGKQPS